MRASLSGAISRIERFDLVDMIADPNDLVQIEVVDDQPLHGNGREFKVYVHINDQTVIRIGHIPVRNFQQSSPAA